MRNWFAFGLGLGKRLAFFEPGEIRLAILSLLTQQPKHGYQLMKELGERSGGLYRASAGSVYPTLQQLEDEALVEMKLEHGRHVYRITKAGLKELGKDPEAVARIWARAERWEDVGQYMGPESFGFAPSLRMIMKAVFRAAARAAGDPEQERRVREIIEDACRDLDKI